MLISFSRLRPQAREKPVIGLVSVLWTCWILYCAYTFYDWSVRGNNLDLMLMLAGPMVLGPMPSAYAVRERLSRLLARMTGAFLIDFGSGAREAAFQKRFERWTNGCGLAMAAVIVTALLWSVWYFYDARIVGSQIQVNGNLSLGQMALLMAVMVVAGGASGYALGRYCGNGLLPWHLARAGIALRRPSRAVDVHPIFEDLRRTYVFNLVVWLMLSLWFAGWIFATHSPWAEALTIDDKRDWAVPFLGLWVLTLAIFSVAVFLPVTSWHRQIAALRIEPDDPAGRGADGLPATWLGGGVLSGAALTAFGLLNLAGIAAAIAVIRNGVA